MAVSNVKFRVDARDAIAKIRELGNASGRLARQNLKTQKTFGGLQGVLTKLALVETGRRMVKMASSFKQTQIRLELLSKQYGENKKAQELAARAADKFGLSQAEALSGITDIYGRLRPIGVTLKEIETTYMGFNVATKLAGVSAGQASGAFLQLSQALGSGRLQGDEYRSIAEQLPILTQAIAKEMGKPVGQIKKLASEGKITSEVVINALRAIERDGGASIEALMKRSPEQQFKNLQNAISDLSVELGEYLIPTTIAVTQVLTALVRGVQDLPDPIKATAVGFAAVTTAVGIAIPVMSKLFNIYRAYRIFLLRKFIPALALTKAAFGWISLGLTAVALGIAALGNQFVQNERAHKEYNELLKGTDTAAVKAAISTRELALAEAQLALQRIEAANKRGQGINPERAFGGSSTATSSDASTSHLEKRIKGLNTQLEELRGRLTEIPAEIAADEIKKASEAMGALKDITAQTSAQFQDAFAKKFSSYAKSVHDFGGQAADIVIKSFRGMEDALVSFVQTGKLSFADFARSIIADMTRIAIRQAIIAPLMGSFSSFLGNTFGPKPVPTGPIADGSAFVPHRAAGGPVRGGSPYMVGERGPELFVPSRSGSITPNHALGGSTTINVSVDASGSEVAGDDAQSNELGKMLAAAIQAELVKQQRPGGLLAA
jgi:tape measure domain-containing protein